jgi:hypothetical protein
VNGERRKYLSVVVLAAVLTARTAVGQEMPMQASDAEVTDTGDLQYCLTNLAAQPATAWSVTVRVTDPNGIVIRHSAITTDEYRAEAQRGMASDEQSSTSLLRLHRPHRFVVPGPFDQRLHLTVTPLAMVFLDGSSVGHARLIASVFQRRAAEGDARRDILKQLRDVRTHYTGMAALKEAINRLSRPATPDPGHTHRMVEEQLRDALTHAEAGRVDAEKALDDQLDLISREYQLALQHSIPRQEN